jgi:beta-lactamase superfamily II metal-dependent hydrolase
MIRVIVEKYSIVDRLILLDFISEIEFRSFCSIINQDIIPSDKRSMLLIENVIFSPDNTPREGKLYIFSEKDIGFFNWEREPNELLGEYDPNLGSSDIIAFRADNINKMINFFTNPLKNIPNLFLNDMGNIFDEVELFPFCGIRNLCNENISVIIRNVGQGNWNEIYDIEGCKIIYDIGASIRYTNIQVKNLVNNSNAFSYNPSLLISHWDIDHYRGVFQLDENQIGNICCVYAPAKIPNLTTVNAINKLRNLNVPLYFIPEQMNRKVPRRISLEKIISDNCIALFRGESSSDRNKSGLVLSIWQKTESIILAGDHYYYQIFEDVATELPLNVRINIVTPHHGGKAGSLNKFRKGRVKANIAVTSTGDNSYGHPFAENERHLKRIGFYWVQTDNLNADILIKIN